MPGIALVAASDFLTRTAENDVSDPHPDGGISRMDRTAPAFPFQPALVTHNLGDLGKLFPDHFGFGDHNNDWLVVWKQAIFPNRPSVPGKTGRTKH
jgi:hypothetical protein